VPIADRSESVIVSQLRCFRKSAGEASHLADPFRDASMREEGATIVPDRSCVNLLPRRNSIAHTILTTLPNEGMATVR
jgi:hypothetical protein